MSIYFLIAFFPNFATLIININVGIQNEIS